MSSEDIIRRLKVLSKSQSAFLKQYCHKKLTDGAELMKETINLLKHSDADDRKVTDLKRKLEQLKLDELEVDVESAKLFMSYEMKALKDSIENSETLLPTPPVENKNSGDNNIPSAVKALEADNAKLRDLLEKAKAEIVSLAKAASKTDGKAMPPAPPTGESSSEDSEKVRSLETTIAEKDTQIKRLELVCIQLEEEKDSVNKHRANTESAEVGRLKASLDNLQSKYDEAIADYEAKITRIQQKTQESQSDMETRLETEKEEMMEAMAQEVEEVEKQSKEQIAIYERKLKDKDAMLEEYEKKMKGMITQLDKATSGQNSMIKGFGKVKGNFSEIKKAKKNLIDETKISLSALSASITKEIGASLKSKLKSVNDALKEATTRYKKEMTERKKLHNMVQELKGNIRVYMRCRPPTKKELEQFGDEAICVSFPPGEENEVKLINEKGREKVWEFDKLFNLESSQSEIYSEVSALVTSVLDGYNVCIFAYGQTGSGKTYTMAGPSDDKGVNTRSLDELFEKVEERKGEWEDTVAISVLEVYNEEIRDLLSDGSHTDKLEIRQIEGGGGQHVPGLKIVEVSNMRDIESHLATADSNRASACTNMNEHSSRSHMILCVYVQCTNLITGVVSRGKLNLVDLAGSERVNKSGAQGQAMKEAQNINKSLSALGDVIQARGAKQAHVPFRNSTLTYLLQDSLSQDSKTLMFVCISPVLYNSEESFCSLNFASRVRAVELGKATKNISAAGSVTTQKGQAFGATKSSQSKRSGDNMSSRK